MPVSRQYTPSPMLLPSGRNRFNNELGLACGLLESVACCNKNVVQDVEGLAARFVSPIVQQKRQHKTVFAFAKSLFALCPKTWPAALWMIDAICQDSGLVFSPSTARRLLAGTVYLILSTDEDAHDLYTLMSITSKSEAQLARLGKAALLLLQGEATPSEGSVCSEAAQLCWEDQLGLTHIGWVLGALPRAVRTAEKEFRKCTISPDMISTEHGPTVAVPIFPDAVEPASLGLSPDVSPARMTSEISESEWCPTSVTVSPVSAWSEEDLRGGSLRRLSAALRYGNLVRAESE